MSKVNIYKAIAGFSYAIAMADGTVQKEEKKQLERFILDEFDFTDISSAWIEPFFEDMEKKDVAAEDAYQYALDTLAANRYYYDFDEEMKEKCQYFMEKLAEAFGGVDPEENYLLLRFREDVKKYMSSAN